MSGRRGCLPEQRRGGTWCRVASANRQEAVSGCPCWEGPEGRSQVPLSEKQEEGSSAGSEGRGSVEA